MSHCMSITTISAADNFLPLGSRLSMSMELVLEDRNLMPAAVSFQRPPAPAPSTCDRCGEGKKMDKPQYKDQA